MRNIISFICGVVAMILLIIAMVLYLYNYKKEKYFYNAEIWLKDVFIIKDYINNKETLKQRLLIVSGSNSLFGFDSSIIDKNTNFTPINYATHAGLPINFLIDLIITRAKEGDIVFMPLEFGYYTRGEPKDDWWYIHNMFVWGGEYKKYISNIDIFRNLWTKNPLEFFSLVFRGGNSKSNINPILEMQKIWADSNASFRGYSFSSLNIYGDFSTQVGEIKDINTPYLDDDIKISNFFLQEYQRLESFAKSKHIRIFLTYPTMCNNPSFRLEVATKKLSKLKERLKEHDIILYGDFRDFYFDKKYFFDTSYHLNNEGVRLRSLAFVKLLKDMDL